MPDPHLVEYVKKELAAGADASELTAHLASLQWRPEDIQAAISLDKGQQPPAPPETPKQAIPSNRAKRRFPGLENKISFSWLIIVQAALGLEWLSSFLAKILSPNYQIEFGKQVANLSSSTKFGFVSSVLNNGVLPNYLMISYLLEFVELLIALSLLATAAVAFFKRGYNQQIRRPLIASLIGGIVISIGSFLAEGLPDNPSFGATASDIFIALIQIILLISYTYIYFTPSTENS